MALPGRGEARDRGYRQRLGLGRAAGRREPVEQRFERQPIGFAVDRGMLLVDRERARERLLADVGAPEAAQHEALVGQQVGDVEVFAVALAIGALDEGGIARRQVGRASCRLQDLAEFADRVAGVVVHCRQALLVSGERADEEGFGLGRAIGTAQQEAEVVGGRRHLDRARAVPCFGEPQRDFGERHCLGELAGAHQFDRPRLRLGQRHVVGNVAEGR